MFHTIPQEGEPGVETWENGVVALHRQRQRVADDVGRPRARPRLPAGLHAHQRLLRRPTASATTSSPTVDRLRSTRATGERLWHFQTVHHGLWDYDLPAAPNLVDITCRRARRRKRVAQSPSRASFTSSIASPASRSGRSRSARCPPSDVPGERASATQPFPTKPPPFERQGVALDQLVATTPQVQAAALEIVSRYDWGDLFEPPSLRGTIVNPGIGGGGNWGGASVRPGNPNALRHVARQSAVPGAPRARRRARPVVCAAFDRERTARLLQLVQAAQRHHHRLRSRSWRDPLAGPQLRAGGRGRSRVVPGHHDAPLLRDQKRPATLAVLDKASGQRLWEIPLPANASGAPMTYMVGGRQHVLVAVGSGDRQTMELVAFRLPRSAVGSPGAVRFGVASASATERDGSARLTVTRQGGRAGAVTVEVAPVAGPTRGTATTGVDFDAAAHVVEWSDGEGGPKDVVIPILDDGVEEGDETAAFELRNPTGGLTLAAPSSALLTIGDDDVDPCAADAHTHCAFAAAASACAPSSAPRRSTGTGARPRSPPTPATSRSSRRATSRCWSRCTTPAQHRSNDSGSSPPASPTSKSTLTVADTERDVVRRYVNPLGRAFPPIQDTGAFATCP